jgi:D-serine ammonia-lyase
LIWSRYLAGNYPVNGLQQLATGCIEETDQFLRILAEVCSVYPERNEAIINAGAIALSREPGPFPGYGRLVSRPEWHVGRLSQEHGILVSEEGSDGRVEESFKWGRRSCFMYSMLVLRLPRMDGISLLTIMI